MNFKLEVKPAVLPKTMEQVGNALESLGFEIDGGGNSPESTHLTFFNKDVEEGAGNGAALTPPGPGGFGELGEKL